MKKKKVFAGVLLLVTMCFWPVVFGQEPSPQSELWVRGAVVNSEIVGDELAHIKLEVMVLQGRKVNWEVLKNPKNFEPFILENFSVAEKGIPLDLRFKDYNAFEVQIFLSLADKPLGKHETAALPLEISFTNFQYKDQAVEGREKKKTTYLKGFTISKVSLRAELDADMKSLEIGDQFTVTLKIVHNPETHILNLRQPENAGDSESSVLFLDKVKMPSSEMLGVEVRETSESVYRKVTQVAYLLTSFELPPKEFKIGPLAVLYQEKDAESAQSYKTEELNIKLNSVLTKSFRWEETRTPIFSDLLERFWLVSVPYYGSVMSVVLLALMLCFWLANSILAGHKKTGEEILPVQLMLERRSPIPFFLKHWLYLRSNYKKLQTGNKELLENFICHYRLCAGSAEGLSTNRALALTAGQFKRCSMRSALVLGELENSLFENTSLKTSDGKLLEVLNSLAKTKTKESLRRFFNKLKIYIKDAIKKS